MGVLDRERFLVPAIRAFRAVTDALAQRDGEWYMPEISGPTIPLPLFPYLGYKLIPRGDSWSYGLAAAILAGISYQRLATGTRFPMSQEQGATDDQK
jgi:unsaturated rhamnogalacturonyl hydrolase